MSKALWERKDIMDMELTDQQLEFLSDCMEQNLEHARHVENERLTFNSIYMALVAGALAFVFSLGAKWISIIIIILLLVLGCIAMMLTKRWDNAFDSHISYAKGCYRMIHEHLFTVDLDGDGVISENEKVAGLDSLPAYCFRPANPKPRTKFGARLNKIRTRRLFFWFYILMELVLVFALIYFLLLF